MFAPGTHPVGKSSGHINAIHDIKLRRKYHKTGCTKTQINLILFTSSNVIRTSIWYGLAKINSNMLIHFVHKCT